MELKMTMHVWKLFYNLVRKKSRKRGSIYLGKMSEEKWNEWLTIKKELGI